jgi:hypothetical protein
MLKIFVSIVSLATATNVMATPNNCSEYLLKFTDSKSFHVQSQSAHDLNLEVAKNTIETLLEMHCSPEELNINIRDNEYNACSYIIPRNPNSYACYLESTVGYFFVTADLMDNIFVTWNRWD